MLVVGLKAALSDYVRQEWQFSLQADKAGTPILRQGDYPLVPGELRSFHATTSATMPPLLANAILFVQREGRPGRPHPPCFSIVGLLAVDRADHDSSFIPLPFGVK